MRAPSRLAVKLGNYLRRWNERRQISRELMALDDRMLKDIGVNRTEIRAISEGTWMPAGRTRTRPKGASTRIAVLAAQSRPPAPAKRDWNEEETRSAA